jgi:hypothetical protein
MGSDPVRVFSFQLQLQPRTLLHVLPDASVRRRAMDKEKHCADHLLYPSNVAYRCLGQSRLVACYARSHLTPGSAVFRPQRRGHGCRQASLSQSSAPETSLGHHASTPLWTGYHSVMTVSCHAGCNRCGPLRHSASRGIKRPRAFFVGRYWRALVIQRRAKYLLVLSAMTNTGVISA